MVTTAFMPTEFGVLAADKYTYGPADFAAGLFLLLFQVADKVGKKNDIFDFFFLNLTFLYRQKGCKKLVAGNL